MTEPEQPIEPVQAKTRATIKAKSVDPIELELINNDPPKEFRIWAYGLVRTTKGDSVLTKENAKSIIDFWQDKGTLLHFDYEHGTFSDAAEAGQPIPAAGWYKLEARDDGLWAVDIEWTETAYRMIKSREYRYYSPAYDVDTETNQIVGYHNGAITNYPATKNIQVLMKAKAELEATTAKQQLEIARLKREAFTKDVTASVKTLLDAGVPPAVMRLVQPILEADDTATLIKANAKETVKPGELVKAALLEMSKLGAVPRGEITDRQGEIPSITLEDAILEQQKGKPNMRYKDAIIAARAAYPHLKAGN
jgi:hypothetical protein